MYSSRARNIDIPENLFSNLGEIKSRELARKAQEKQENPKVFQAQKSVGYGWKITFMMP